MTLQRSILTYILNNMTKYELVCGDWPPELNKFVNEYLNKGWKLYGNPFGIGTSDDSAVYQAMTIEEVEEIPVMKGTQEALDKLMI
jgi:hypothetical protein